MFKKFAAALLVVMPGIALAHPGEHHGSLLSTLYHLVTEPDHLALAAIAVVLAVAARRKLKLRKQQSNHN